MKFISPHAHGIIDFFVVLFLIASPVFFRLEGFVAIFTYVLAVVHLILTLLTENSGVFKVISLRLHGIIELIVGVTLIILAFTLFKNTGSGKIFYSCFGTAVLLVWLFTDYKVAGHLKR